MARIESKAQPTEKSSHTSLDKSLGGVHSSEVRKLLAQKTQQENERLDQLKAVSFDFRFAQAEAYYYQRYQEMLEKACKHKMVPEGEIRTEEKERRR